MSFLRDLKVAFHSLLRTQGLTITVILTLALGIGANAAIFTLVRGVLLKPLVNRDEDRLIYIRQSAPGAGDENSTFSVPELQDLRSRVKTLTAFGDFSTIGFTMVGVGEPREVRAGVVGGTYFDVMGLHPVLGRLIGPQDDGPTAPGVVVLTYRFWTTALMKDPSVLGKTVRLDSGLMGNRSATIIGVLEPSVPYPQETEIIANVVTSPHHLSATMVTDRLHRMTELFGRLAPGVTLDQARAELRTVYGAMTKQHPESYAPKADYQISAKLLRDQITSGARTVLLVLLAASALVFIIACSNVANLILTRTVRREGELAVRSALGASTGALRRMLLAETLLLCGAGAALGVMSAQPLVTVLARYASRFSVRAIDLTVDSSLLWVGAALAIVAAVILAFVPRLPSAGAANGLNLSSGSVRITGNSNRRQRVFAVIQIAASFVLLAGASMLITTLIALQTARTDFDTRHVLAINVPAMSYGKTPQQVVNFYKESIRRIDALPGVNKTSFGMVVPFRDGGFALQFSADGHVRASGEEDPRAELRVISPGFFASLGVPIIAGRDFNDLDAQSDEPVAIISETLAKRMFPNQDPIDRHVFWTDPVLRFAPVISPAPRRIVGVTADIDDVHIVPQPVLAIFSNFEQAPIFGGRLFIHTDTNPYALVTPVTRVLRDMSADQPIEHAATLADVRAEVLAPDRLNSLVFGVFAAVALAIALVGVAAVLAFSVSSRTREFGIRLALGSQPQHLLKSVISEGALMAGVGVLAGAAFGFVAARLSASYFPDMKMPGALPVVLSAFVLLAAAVVASSVPAARAARIDVIQALHSE
jgi:putative ABC transport system permease protein